jgi:glycoprotein endo-alpha-1,2-mannosidase
MMLPRTRLRGALCAVIVLCFLFSGHRGQRYLVGAHYYVWYPRNFARGYLRARLSPPQATFLAEYDSADPKVAERQIALAASHGVDFFTVDWWPSRPSQNQAIDSGLLGARNIDRIRFCIFYETLDLASASDRHVIVFDDATRQRFVSDLTAVARRYFAHPSYLRVDGRPVIVLYATRQIRGQFARAMQELRTALAAEGNDPFVIGDEIFWIVVVPDDDPEAPLRMSGEPQARRFQLFDAITGYNLYAVERASQRGYGATSKFLRESVRLYRRYREASAVPIVPDVIPGFNDRGARLAVDHFAIPRRWSADAPEGSFFAESIDRVGKPLADPKLRMILITSWNEWNEDTAIEPLEVSPPTVEDRSGERLFSQGYAYEGFGSSYLEIVRNRLAR